MPAGYCVELLRLEAYQSGGKARRVSAAIMPIAKGRTVHVINRMIEEIGKGFDKILRELGLGGAGWRIFIRVWRLLERKCGRDLRGRKPSFSSPAAVVGREEDEECRRRRRAVRTGRERIELRRRRRAHRSRHQRPAVKVRQTPMVAKP